MDLVGTRCLLGVFCALTRLGWQLNWSITRPCTDLPLICAGGNAPVKKLRELAPRHGLAAKLWNLVCSKPSKPAVH